MVFVFIEILFKILLFKGGVLIYAEYCILDGRNKKSIVSYYVLSFISWCRKIHCLPPRGVKGRQNDQPGQNQEFVPKRETTSVAWSCVFKHCSFKTTDFKPVENQTTELYVCAVSVSVWEKRAFFHFIGFERLHKHTYMRQNPCLCKYPNKHSDLGLKSE